MPEPRFSEAEMCRLAAEALGTIDRLGHRGLTLVSLEQIAAMAALLAVGGLAPIYPGGVTARAATDAS